MITKRSTKKKEPVPLFTPRTYRLRTSVVEVVCDGPASAPVSSGAAIHSLARKLYEDLDADKEHFGVILLDARNVPVGFKVISTGILTASLVHPREVFSYAIRESAEGVCLIHNHPSGDRSPSPEDCEITRRLCEAGNLVGIKVLDHIIMGSRGQYTSMLERGFIS